MTIARNDVVPRADLDLLYSRGFKQCTGTQTEFHNGARRLTGGETLKYLIYDLSPLGDKWIWVRWAPPGYGAGCGRSERFTDLRACYAHAELTNWGEV